MNHADSQSRLRSFPTDRIILRAAFGLCLCAGVCAGWMWPAGSPLVDNAEGQSQSIRQDAADTNKPASVDPSIPTPDSITSNEVGGQAVRYDALVRYLRALADSSPLATLTAYATSHEGRELYYLTISSERNHANLVQIQ